MPDIIQHADLFNRAAPGANSDILTDDVTPRQGRSLWRISVVLATSSVFNMTETRAGVSNTYGLNESVALQAGDEYDFVIGVSNQGAYNFQVETNGIIRRLLIVEVTGQVT